MTAFLNLTPTQQPKTGTGAPVNLTALLAAGGLGSNTGVEFTNSGREVLYVQQTSTPTTIIVAIGTTVEGEPVTPITFSGVASAIQMVGPFNQDEDFQPGGIIEVTFGVAADITAVALVQNTGIY
jgi:hypothetical protein